MVGWRPRLPVCSKKIRGHSFKFGYDSATSESLLKDLVGIWRGYTSIKNWTKCKVTIQGFKSEASSQRCEARNDSITDCRTKELEKFASLHRFGNVGKCAALLPIFKADASKITTARIY